jgi:hypothetical protein
MAIFLFGLLVGVVLTEVYHEMRDNGYFDDGRRLSFPQWEHCQILRMGESNYRHRREVQRQISAGSFDSGNW